MKILDCINNESEKTHLSKSISKIEQYSYCDQPNLLCKGCMKLDKCQSPLKYIFNKEAQEDNDKF